MRTEILCNLYRKYQNKIELHVVYFRTILNTYIYTVRYLSCSGVFLSVFFH